MECHNEDSESSKSYESATDAGICHREKDSEDLYTPEQLKNMRPQSCFEHTLFVRVQIENNSSATREGRAHQNLHESG